MTTSVAQSDGEEGADVRCVKVVREQGGVLVITLNAPERRNAISPDMRAEMLAQLQQAVADQGCRAIVVTGAGEHFSAGGDLKAVPNGGTAPDPDRTRRNTVLLQEIVRILATGPKPVVSAVEGIAYGAGMSIAVAADHLVTGRGGRFCAAFSRVGLLPDAGLLWSLPRRLGVSRAKEIMISARVVDSEEAVRIGLADEAVEDGTTRAVAIARAQAMALAAPLTVAATRAILAESSASLEDVFAAELENQPRLSLTQDYAEGRAAFKERRAPAFRGL